MSDERAQEIAKGALRIDWWDTESAARRVAEYAADLAPTDAQIEAHPKVQALASALRMADAAIRGSNINMRVLERRIIEALAALEEKN